MATECQASRVVLPFASRAQTSTQGSTEVQGYILEVSIVVPPGEVLPVTNAARPRCIRPAPAEAFLPSAGATAAPLPTIAGCSLCNHSVAVQTARSCPYWEHPSNRRRLAR